MVCCIARILAWAFALLLILKHLKVNIIALVTRLGAGRVAIAQAVQNILDNLFASLSIILDKPFVVGDHIVVNDAMGTLQHIGLKTTRVRSLGGKLIAFSNTDLLKSRIRIYRRGIVEEQQQVRFDGEHALIFEVILFRTQCRY